MPEVTYLHVDGVLDEEHGYRARRGWETTAPAHDQGQDDEHAVAGGGLDSAGDLRLVLLGRDGEVLLSVTPQVRTRGCGQAGDPSRTRVRGEVPLQPDGAVVQVRHGERVLNEVVVPPSVPPLSGVTVQRTDEGLSAAWDPVDHPAAAGPITYDVVVVTQTGRRLVLVRGLAEPACRVAVGDLPDAGRAVVSVVAGDSVRSTTTELGDVDVPLRPPTPHILGSTVAPDDGAEAAAGRWSVPFGEPVALVGACLDMAGRPCPPEPVVWLLDDEPVAWGSVLAVLDRPAAGTHRLTLAYGEGDQRVESSTVLDVAEPDDEYREWAQLVGVVD